VDKIDPVSDYFLRRAGGHGAVALMYHSINPEGGEPDWPWAVSRKRFLSQITLLHDAGWKTLSISELLATNASTHQRKVIITFDDGYVDNLAAVEILHSFNMCATWFVVSGCIGRKPNWFSNGEPPGRLLDASELRDMRALGMEIGSHTVRHHPLTKLDPESRAIELRDSKTSLENTLGHGISHFAYPYGATDAECERAVVDAGYLSASTTRTGWALRDQNPLGIRRLTVFNTDTIGSFSRKLYFGSHAVAWGDVLRYGLGRCGWRIRS
jgi:peptidoglycan/xylan/chitin deacetylase (PgdA/CDA1 family)